MDLNPLLNYLQNVPTLHDLTKISVLLEENILFKSVQSCSYLLPPLNSLLTFVVLSLSYLEKEL